MRNITDAEPVTRDITLSTGRVAKHRRMDNGAQEVFFESGPQEMTAEEWEEYANYPTCGTHCAPEYCPPIYRPFPKLPPADDRAGWITKHGSNRLKRCLAEGIEHEAIYRDERLAIDRPGWEWAENVLGERHEPRNPPSEAFDLLDEARKVQPDAKLAYWTLDRDEPYDEFDRYAWTGYLAEASFMGETIYYAPADGWPCLPVSKY